MRYDCILFDLDGTLLNTLDDLADSLNYTLIKYNMPTRTLDEVRRFVGNGLPKLVERAIPEGRENPQYQAFLKEFVEYYNCHNMIKTGPYPGIMDCVARLKQAGLKMAIVTNKGQTASDSLLQAMFYPTIELVIGDDGKRRHKPESDGVEAALQALEVVDKSRVLYVGDSEVDAQTGINSGIDFVLCSWGFRDRADLEQYKPLAFIDDINQLCSIIDLRS